MNVLSSHNILQNDHQNSNSEPIFVEWRRDQIEKFGKEPLLINHNLARHPLFQVPRLEKLARAIHASVIEGRAVDAQIKIRRDRPELSGIERMSSWGSKTEVALGEGWED